jgi:hypothetical protein
MVDLKLPGFSDPKLSVDRYSRSQSLCCLKGTLKKPVASIQVCQKEGEHWTIEVVIEEGYCHRGRWPKGDSLEEATAHAVRVAQSHRKPKS